MSWWGWVVFELHRIEAVQMTSGAAGSGGWKDRAYAGFAGWVKRSSGAERERICLVEVVVLCVSLNPNRTHVLYRGCLWRAVGYYSG